MVLRKTNFFLCMMITSWHTPYFCDGELSAIISKRHKAIQATAAERAHHETSLCKSIVSLSFYFLLFLFFFFPPCSSQRKVSWPVFHILMEIIGSTERAQDRIARMHSGVASYLFNHIFLPGELPQQDDYNPAYEIVLLDKVIEALGQFKNHVSTQEADICSAAITAIIRLKEIYNGHGGMDEALTGLGNEGK